MEQQIVKQKTGEHKNEKHKTVEHQTSAPSIAEARTISDPELISVCECLLSGTSSNEDSSVHIRKRNKYSRVSITETYLRERRIPDLIRYLLTKIMCSNERNVAVYVSDLLNKCMIFRSGLGGAPVLFEERHLKAVVKSFDPGERGWLTVGQVRRAFATLGLTLTDLESKNLESKNLESKNLESKNSESKNLESKNLESKNSESKNLEVKIPTTEVLDLLRTTQERELLSLLTAGTQLEEKITE